MARRPLERERIYRDGGRRTTQLMRDSLGSGTDTMSFLAEYGWLLVLAVAVLLWIRQRTSRFQKSGLRPEDPYFNQWMTYRRVWRRSIVLVPLFFFGPAILTTLILEPLWPNPPGWVVVVLLAPGIITTIVVSQGPVRWRCPRCGKPFHSTSWSHNGFALRCLNCKLPKWAPGPDVDEQPKAAA